ncbi:hypothetical protein [Providencia sp. PROV079]|uniref:hypothetical protein n=1 Tax=Providencia sp. PROV079 TaxID=2949800 RepID=UPI00234A5303|nr:hypothetical protein [Providencia sp. PROV079]
MNLNLKNNTSIIPIMDENKSKIKNTKTENNEVNNFRQLATLLFNEENINISDIQREREYLTAMRDDFISNVHNYVPLKSAISDVSEESYYQTIRDALLYIIEQHSQLNEMKVLEQIDTGNINIQEGKITNLKNNLVKYIHDYSENKDNNLISQDISALLNEIYNTDLKIRSIDVFIKKLEKETVEALYNILKDKSDDVDTVSLLSSTMANLEQNTANHNFNPETSNTTLPLVLMPIRN